MKPKKSDVKKSRSKTTQLMSIIDIWNINRFGRVKHRTFVDVFYRQAQNKIRNSTRSNRWATKYISYQILLISTSWQRKIPKSRPLWESLRFQYRQFDTPWWVLTCSIMASVTSRIGVSSKGFTMDSILSHCWAHL